MKVLTFFFILLVGSKPCASLQVIVKSFEIRGVSDRLMPEHVSVKLTTMDNVRLDLNLRHVPHLDVALPVEFIRVDKEGQLVTRAEHIIPSSDVSYYQDDHHKAAIQLTRYWDKTHELFGYNMRGHVIFHDSIFYLDAKTDNTSQSEVSYQFVTPLPNEPPVQIVSLEGRQINLVMEMPVQGLKCQEHFTANETRDSSRKEKRKPPRRQNQSRKSRNSNMYFIDIIGIVDFGLHNKIKQSIKGPFQQKLYENFAFLFNEVDLLYKNLGTEFTLNIRLVKILISENKEAVPFTDSNAKNGKIDSVEALELIQHYFYNDGEQYLEESDHVMVFTSLDLFGVVDGAPVYSVAGASNNGMMCRNDGTSSSIIEYHNTDFTLVIIVTHELGHSLASYHDGSNNNCSPNDRYIMAPRFSPETPNTILNPFKFSSCSIETFRYFIDALLPIKEDRDCLTKYFPLSKDIPIIGNRLKGLEMSPDEQCEEFRGKGSTFCRAMVPASQVCTKLYCSHPFNLAACKSYVPHPGTPCGKDKICRLGKCEADTRGPDVKDSQSTRITASTTVTPKVFKPRPRLATASAKPIFCPGKLYNYLVFVLSCLCHFLLCELSI